MLDGGRREHKKGRGTREGAERRRAGRVQRGALNPSINAAERRSGRDFKDFKEGSRARL